MFDGFGVKKSKSKDVTARVRPRGLISRATLVVAVAAGATIATVPIATAAYAAGGWSAPTNIDPASSFDGVSCATQTFCVAVDAAGSAFHYNGSAWTGDTANPIDPGGGGFSAVDCPTTNFCTAVDNDGNAFYFNGSAWTADLSNPVDPSGGGFATVSCTSSTFCAAGDYDGDAFTYNGTSWTADPSNPIDLGNALISVSCPAVPSPSLVCMGVSFSGNAFVFDGTSWTPTSVDPGNEFDSVSCPTADFCQAVDWNGDGFTYNSGTWSSATAVDPAGNLLNWVDCVSPTFCAAVGSTGNEFLYHGTTWSGAPNIDPDAATNTFNLWTASCPTTTFCVAVDFNSGNVFTYSSSTLQIITANTLPNGAPNVSYSSTLAAQGGNPAYTWKLEKGSGKLPKGLKLNKNTGAITGTPKSSDAGNYTFTIEVLDKKVKVKHHRPTQNIDTRDFSITIS